MADVHLLSNIICYILNANKFEQFMHSFFAKVCIDLEIEDKNGYMTMPKGSFFCFNRSC